MNLLKDKKIIALGVILLLFTIVYFVAINKISYAFETDNLSKESYNNLISTIKECAKVYANKNEELFKEETTVYIKIQDLIDSELLIPNNGENVISPIDNKTVLNSNIIKIKKEDNTFIIDVDN